MISKGRCCINISFVISDRRNSVPGTVFRWSHVIFAVKPFAEIVGIMKTTGKCDLADLLICLKKQAACSIQSQ